jgi:hypothetical protein
VAPAARDAFVWGLLGLSENNLTVSAYNNLALILLIAGVSVWQKSFIAVVVRTVLVAPKVQSPKSIN